MPFVKRPSVFKALGFTDHRNIIKKEQDEDDCICRHHPNKDTHKKIAKALCALAILNIETFLKTLKNYQMVSPAGIEPAAPNLGGSCSIRLSYGDKF